jgi:uncharacterized membrane protein
MSTNSLDTAHSLRRTVWMVFVFSLAGVAFSGVLSYRELTGAAAGCQIVGAPGTIFGLPACVYGLAVFTLLAVLSGFGLLRTRRLRQEPA